ncbi:unnamed protein product [Ascophyllum nodosum]
MDTCTSSSAARQIPVEKHERGQVGERLSADSWLVNAILPPDASGLVFESLQPVAAAMQECEMIQEGNEASAFDDDELGIQVVQMLGRRCSVSFPCSSILQYLCLHVKVWKNKFVPPQVRSVCTRVQDLALRNAYTIFSTYLTNVTKGPCSRAAGGSLLTGAILKARSAVGVSGSFGRSVLKPKLLAGLLSFTLDKYFSFEVEIVDDSKHYRYIDISNNRSVADMGGDRALLPLELREGWQRINIDLERIARIAFGTSYLTASQITLRASARIAKVFFQSEPFSDYELPSHLRAIAE